MLKALLLLASSVTQEEILESSHRQSFRLDPTDTVLVLGAIVVVVGLLFFWAFYVRKRPDTKHGSPRLLGSEHSHRHHHHHRRRHHRHHHQPQDQQSGGQESRDPERVRVRKRRRRHPDHYPRNPTLGETGGLPPLKPEPPPEETDPTQPGPPRSAA